MTQYLKIDSLSPENVNDMFDAICTHVIQMDRGEALRKYMGIQNGNLKTHKCTIGQLMTLLAKCDILTELKVVYDDGVKAKVVEPPKEVEVAFMKPDKTIEKIIEKQERQITAPGVKVESEDDLPEFLRD